MPQVAATRWGGTKKDGAAAPVVAQHLAVAMGSLPRGRWTSREERFDPNNPLFPEVCQVRGMHMGVPLRSKVTGPSGFFGVKRRDPVSIGASVARAKALAARNAARNADANAAAREAPLTLDVDGTLREQAPTKVPFIGSSAPRMGSVEFYRSGDVRAPLLASPAVSGRVPHGASVEQLLHGGAAGKPVAAAIRDRDGASAAFTATARGALWSDRHPSTTAMAGRAGVGNIVAEADVHLRYVDSDAAAAQVSCDFIQPLTFCVCESCSPLI